MNFDDFNLSSFEIDSEMPTYEPVDNFHSHNLGYSQKNTNNSKSKIQTRKTTQHNINKKSKSNEDYGEEDDDDDAYVPKPKKLVRPIMSGQFDPFTNFFITITKVQNLDNCSNRSLFLKIRVHPSIPIIESPCVWCSNRDAIFNVAYSLDFTKIPPFNLGDFTPVIELYRRYNSSNELIAVTLLPLKTIKENMKCGPSNKMLTYLYREAPVVLKDLTSGSTIGSMKITIAFGFKEHEPLLDPNTSNPMTPNYFSENNFSFHHPHGLNGDKNDQKEYSQGVVKPNILPIQIENISQNYQINSKNVDNKIKKSRKKTYLDDSDDYNDYEYESDANEKHKRKGSHHRRHGHDHCKRKRNKNKEFNWVDEAISLGWKPPGSSESDWKAKARSKGWKPPNEALMSDIGVYCDPNGNNMREFRSNSTVQTEPEITGLPPKAIVIPQIEEEESLASSSNDAFNDLELLELLNPKLSQKQNKKMQKINKSNKNKKCNTDEIDKKQLKKNDLLISEPQSYSEQSDVIVNLNQMKNREKTELNFVKCVTLFEEAPNINSTLLDDKSDGSDDSDGDINHQDIQQILNKISQNSNLKSFKQNSADLIQKISNSDDSDNDSINDSNLNILSFQKDIEDKNKSKATNNSINNVNLNQILIDQDLNSITPIDNDEIRQSVSSIIISDSDSENGDNINISKEDDIDVSSDSDIEHINNLAKKDSEFFEIYNKYMNL